MKLVEIQVQQIKLREPDHVGLQGSEQVVLFQPPGKPIVKVS